MRDAIVSRVDVGGLVVGPEDATAYTASGGAPYAAMVEGMTKGLEAQGKPVETEDLAPTSEDDPQTTGAALLGLPLAFGGIISAAIATFGFRGNEWAKISVLVGIALMGSLVATWMLHTVYGTLTGSFAMEWLAIAAGILAIFLANPLSGLSTGPWLMPADWSTLGQWMPIGATGFLVRSLAFFDGAGATGAWWVLAVWIAAGFVMLMFDCFVKHVKAR